MGAFGWNNGAQGYSSDIPDPLNGAPGAVPSASDSANYNPNLPIYQQADQERRKWMLGVGQQAANPEWNQDQLNNAAKNQAQSNGLQFDAYNRALALANGGSSAAQRQLADAQTQQNQGLATMAGQAGGGARGAAAAQGLAYNALGSGVGMQAAQMGAQRAHDMQQGSALALQIANQGRDLQQQAANAEYGDQFRQAGLKQAYQGLGDAGVLNYLGLNQSENLAQQGINSGLSAQLGDQALARQQQDQQFSNQLFGAGMSGLAAGAGALGSAATNGQDSSLPYRDPGF